MELVNGLIELGTAAMNLAAAALGAGLARRAIKRRRDARNARNREEN